MRTALPPSTARFGAAAGAAVALLSAAYAVVLGIGLLTLPSPDQPIHDPWFTAMELLILGIAPAMVGFMVALHAGAPPERQAIALLGVAFLAMCAVVTCAVHFAVLTLGRQPAFAGAPWGRLVFSFTWPSLAYALDILAWDVFFPLGALCAARAVPPARFARAVRALLWASAGLAFAGLLGVPLADMQLRNIGIVGYAVLFPIAAALAAADFHRSGVR